MGFGRVVGGSAGIVLVAAVVAGVHGFSTPIVYHEQGSGGGRLGGSGAQAREMPGGAPAAADEETGADAAEQPASMTTSAPAFDADCAGLVGVDLPERIDLEMGRRLYACAFTEGIGAIWFLDARTESDFTEGHIAGSIYMSAGRIRESGLNPLYDMGGTETDFFVIYCTGGACDASENTAALLRASGAENFVIMEAGYDDWVEAGLPTESGAPEPTF